jgi:hypothetical protein
MMLHFKKVLTVLIQLDLYRFFIQKEPSVW